jgi:histone deacetylase complex regulatory component SIN3
MRELRVEDALMYLDQVKIQFGDRPHIYNEFLHIMKTFKSQEIDTPGVILRVTRLFQGNKGLVLGFNTFLPDGYRIEIPDSVSGTVYYRTPFQQQLTPIHPIVLPSVGNRTENQFDPRLSNQQQQQQQQQPLGSNGGPSSAGGDYVNMQMQQQQQQQPTQQQQQPGHLMGGPLQGTSNGPHSSSHNSHPHGLPPQTQQPQPHQQQQHHPHAPGLRHGNMMQNGLSQGQQVQVGFQQRPQGQKLSSEMPSHMQQQKQHPHLNMQYSGVAGGQVEKMHEVSSMHVPSQQQQAMQHSQIRSTGDIQMQQASKENVGVQPMQQKHPMMQHSQQQVEEPSPGPVEFDHAINYVTTIKKTFANDPDTYRKFLEILHTYQKEQRGIKDVLDEVSVLFADHPVLLKDFTYFLPDAVQQQAKIQLAQAVRQAESRRAALNSKQAIETQARQQRPAPPIQAPEPQDAQVWDASQPRKPFGVKEGRSELRERQICNSAVYGVVSFDPVRPPRKHELTPAQAAAKYGRPRTIPEVIVQPTTKEATFFERAKEHLMKKELASEKAAGSRKHTPYAEFLKCLHLYGGGILNKKELLSLLRTLFIQGHAPKSGANASGGSNNPKIASAASKLLKDFEKVRHKGLFRFLQLYTLR